MSIEKLRHDIKSIPATQEGDLKLAQMAQNGPDMMSRLLAGVEVNERARTRAAEAAKKQQAAQQGQVQRPVVENKAQELLQAGVASLPQAEQAFPEQQAGYATGGIIAFANRGYVDGDAEDDDLLDESAMADEDAEDQMIADYTAALQSMAPAAVGLGSIKTSGEAPSFGISPESKEAIGITAGKKPVAGESIHAFANQTAEKYGVDPRLVSYVMNKETGGHKDPANAVSKAGALGYMQLMPGTAKELGVKDPFDPYQNIDGGIRYLAQLQRKYGDEKLAAIAYNWGPGNTDKWLKAGAEVSKLPKETRNYVASLAQGGEVKHFDGLTGSAVQGVDTDLMSEIDAIGAELDAARQELKALPMTGSRQQAYTPGIAEKYKAAKEKADALETKYNALMVKAGMNKPSFRTQPSMSLGPKQKPDPYVAALGAQPPVNANPAANKISQAEYDASSEADDASFGNLSAAAAVVNDKKDDKKGAPAQKPKSFEDEMREYFAAKKEQIAADRKEAKNMALLEAGLGMMGGTSPYAFANIGQGALQGARSYADSKKQAAAEEKALLQGQLGMYRYSNLAKAADAARKQQAITSRSAAIDNAIAKEMGLRKLDAQYLGSLKMKKNKKPEDIAEINRIEKEIEDIRAAAEKRYPDVYGQDTFEGFSLKGTN